MKMAIVLALLVSSAAVAQPAPSDRNANQPSGPASNSDAVSKSLISDSALGASSPMPAYRLDVPAVSNLTNCADEIGTAPGATPSSGTSAGGGHPISAEVKANGCYIELPDKSGGNAKPASPGGH
jgi:hypothetical protein